MEDNMRRLALLVMTSALILSFGFGAIPRATAQACPAGQWAANFYNSTDLSGAPAVSLCNVFIDFNWGFGAPLNGVGIDNFSVRWSSVQNFATPGNYTFTVTAEDGVRLYVNGALVINAFNDSGGVQNFSATVALSAGNVPIILEYVTFVGNSQIKIDWTGGGSVSGDGWLVQYYNNLVWGEPALAQETYPANGINKDWGRGAPVAGFPEDGWSSRWTRQVDFPAGTYTFYLRADDGAKLRINGGEVLNQAEFVQNRTLSTSVALPAGRHIISVEHHDIVDLASLFLTWTPAVGTTLAPGGGGSTTPTTPTVPTGGLIATVNTGALNFRVGPSASADIIQTIRRGEQFQVIARNADASWVQLIVNNQQGWARSSFLAFNGDLGRLAVSDGTNIVQPLPEGAVLATSRAFMKVRNGPGSNYARIDGIPVGKVVSVIGVSADGGWLQISYDGKQGWSAAGFYRFVQGNLSGVPVVQG